MNLEMASDMGWTRQTEECIKQMQCLQIILDNHLKRQLDDSTVY